MSKKYDDVIVWCVMLTTVVFGLTPLVRLCVVPF